MELQDLLAKCFLFRELDAGQRARLAQAMTRAHFHKGELVFDANTAGESMYFIDSGSVAVESNEKEIARLGTGSHFGELALLDGDRRSATVRSVEQTDVLVLPRERFEALMAEDPKLAATLYRAFCRYLSARLRRTNEQTAFLREQLDR